MNVINQVIDNLDCTKITNKHIFISNSIINTLNLDFTSYDCHISIKNCQIINLKIHSVWFKQGLLFENNIIKNKIQYEMGGHNEHSIKLINNIFCELVVFFDCHFIDKLILQNNIFCRGATVMADLSMNTFQSGIELKNNIGDLNINQI
ncbi:hypothetical protein LJB92_04025 [Bacteroidales bacterium OttesenSCG-928-M06]|nr:hypothetical protein [Bacteroidales bacterium OttesenSCG-928-M06]